MQGGLLDQARPGHGMHHHTLHTTRAPLRTHTPTQDLTMCLEIKPAVTTPLPPSLFVLCCHTPPTPSCPSPLHPQLPPHALLTPPTYRSLLLPPILLFPWSTVHCPSPPCALAPQGRRLLWRVNRPGVARDALPPDPQPYTMATPGQTLVCAHVV